MTTGELLTHWLYKFNLSVVEGMNLLQDQGVISDLCVWPDDVAESDVKSAIYYLRSKYENAQRQNTCSQSKANEGSKLGWDTST